MLLLGTKNTTAQTVLTNGLINLGVNYRKYCKRTSEGLPTFVNNGNSITFNGSGFYKITATFVGTGTTAGNVTIQMYENGVAIPGAISTNTITTASTELRTFTIDYIVKVDNECILGCWSVAPKTISFVNTGVGATFTNVVVNSIKEVK